MLNSLDLPKVLVGSYEWLDNLLEASHDCPIAEDMFRRHLARGLANYAVRLTGDPDVGVLVLRQHDLLLYAMDQSASVTSLGMLAQMHKASISNVTPHKTLDEVLRAEGDSLHLPLSLTTIASRLTESREWLSHIESCYRNLPFQGGRWEVLVSLAIDLSRLLAAQQMATPMVAPTDLFTRQKLVDENSIVAGVHNTLAALYASNTQRQDIPGPQTLLTLLSRPEAALRCEEGSPFISLPPMGIMVDIARQSGQLMPASMITTANPDALVDHLKHPDPRLTDGRWALLTLEYQNTQAFVVEDVDRPGNYTVYVAGIQAPVVTPAGQLTSNTRDVWDQLLASMVSGASRSINRLASAV